jgi:hypothetical protein
VDSGHITLVKDPVQRRGLILIRLLTETATEAATLAAAAAAAAAMAALLAVAATT